MYIYTGKGVEKVSINTTIKDKKNEAKRNNRYKYLKEKITNVVKNQEKLKKSIEENNITNVEGNDVNDVFIFDKNKNVIKASNNSETNKEESNTNLEKKTKENNSEISYLEGEKTINKLDDEMNRKLNYQMDIKQSNKIINQEISQINMQMNYPKSDHQINIKKHNEINKQVTNQIHYQKDYQLINHMSYQRSSQMINQKLNQINNQIIYQKNNEMFNDLNSENNKINIINHKKNEKIYNINNEVNILNNQIINLKNKIDMINNKKNGKINNINNKINLLNNKISDQTNNINNQINNINNQIFILCNEKINKMYKQIYDHLNNLNYQINNKLNSQINNQLNNPMHTPINNQIYNQINNVKSQINNLHDQVNNHIYIQKSSHMYNQINNQINNLSNQIDNQINFLNNRTSSTSCENENKIIVINEIDNDKNKFLKIKKVENFEKNIDSMSKEYNLNEYNLLQNLDDNITDFSGYDEKKYINNQKFKVMLKNNENINFKNQAYINKEYIKSLSESSSTSDNYIINSEEIKEKYYDKKENGIGINYKGKNNEKKKKSKYEYYVKNNKLNSKSYINKNEKYINNIKNNTLGYNNKTSSSERDNYKNYCRDYNTNVKRDLLITEEEDDNVSEESRSFKEENEKDDKNESEDENEVDKDDGEGSEEKEIDKNNLYNDQKLKYLKNKLIYFNKLRLKKLKKEENNEYMMENKENEEEGNFNKKSYFKKERDKEISCNNIKNVENMKSEKDYVNNCDSKILVKSITNNDNNEKCNSFFEKNNKLLFDKKLNDKEMENYNFIKRNILENSKNNINSEQNDNFSENNKTVSGNEHNIRSNDFVTMFQKLIHNTNEVNSCKENNNICKRKMNEDFHFNKKMNLYDNAIKKKDENQKSSEKLKDSFFLRDELEEINNIKKHSYGNKNIIESSTVENIICKESDMILYKNEKKNEESKVENLTLTNPFTIDQIYDYTVYYYNKINENKGKLDSCDDLSKEKYLKDRNNYNKSSIKENLKKKYNFLKVKKEVFKIT
ncbi:conserved Plasmodium protein, unknown function [Plasmodium relictum]|uniref:Uncharacterized protein n=1 Tax=Plasmodium relictum TaxID=85471 RepID=A0A1J1HHW2_PLARL|nr:conserved Plasmodium protein, unknown function [Plasmodium relictum]CRH04042.1 conserved Plasmodium protein, unknown function [Plasmodium relictum]